MKYDVEGETQFAPILQMHHPIQMKPADSEKNNGKDLQLFDLVKTSLSSMICDIS